MMLAGRHPQRTGHVINFLRTRYDGIVTGDGSPSPVPAEQSLQVMAVLDGIYRSQQVGGEVRLD